LAPRSSAREIVVPKALRLSRRKLPLRILASNGLATGTLSLALEPLKGRRDPDKDPPSRLLVTLVGKAMARASLVDELGRTVTNADIRWFGARGGELARGATLDARHVPGGKQLVRVVAVGAGAGRAERDIEIEGQGRPTPPPRGKPPRRPGDIDKGRAVRYPNPQEPTP
jgi:hypothetical protein